MSPTRRQCDHLESVNRVTRQWEISSSGPNRASALLLARAGALDEAPERHERAPEPQPRRRAARVHRGQPLALRFRAEPRQPVFDQPVSDLDSHCFVPSNLSLIHISEPTRLGMISYAVFCL